MIESVQADLRSHPDTHRPEIKYAPRRVVVGLTLLIGFVALGWIIHHIGVVVGLVEYGAAYPLLFTVLVTVMAQQLVMAWLEKPYTVTPEQEAVLARLRVGVVVPVYNEDDEILRQNLFALLDQTRKLDAIVVVDDGSHDREIDTARCYELARKEWEAWAADVGVKTVWHYQPNGGKRRAQVTGFRLCPEVDIIVTVDSDSVLDRHAIEEGLKPFADPRVQSVGGINVGLNTEHNFLTRLSDLLHIQWQLVARSAQNTRRRITVNSGRLAFYRAEICLDSIGVYLNEEFAGKRVEYSDDSFLTMQALGRGLAVQQPTSLTFTWHPENLSFLLRQRVRWMRGWFVRSFWRFRYLPKTSYAFWSEVIDVMRLSLGTLVTFLVLVWRPLFMGRPLVWLIFAVPIVMSYLTSLRYLTIWHTGQSRWNRLLTFLLSPVVLVWSWVVLRPLRLYAMFTCRNNAWGTRQVIENSRAPAAISGAAQSPRRKLVDALAVVPVASEQQFMRLMLGSEAEHALLELRYRHHLTGAEIASYLGVETTVVDEYSARVIRQLESRGATAQGMPAAIGLKISKLDEAQI